MQLSPNHKKKKKPPSNHRKCSHILPELMLSPKACRVVVDLARKALTIEDGQAAIGFESKEGVSY